MRILLLLSCISIFMVSCSSSFEPVEYGKDACCYCKMTIMDKRFAAEIIDKKGKVFKFDDIACMMHYLAENHLDQAETRFYVARYLKPGADFLDARKADYLSNDFFKTPMRGNTAAFANAAEAKSLKDSLQAAVLSWNDLKY
jgi:copper chaperone NosL